MNLSDFQAGATLANPYGKSVVSNNPGALSVLVRLQHRTRWYEMVEWLDDHGYRGTMLWCLYKDVFRENLYAMGDFILWMMNSQHNRKSSLAYDNRLSNFQWLSPDRKD